MKKLLTAVLVMATISLVGCERAEKFSEQKLTMSVEAVHLSSKSNSKVVLRDVKTGRVQTAPLSCPRSQAENVKLNSLWDITEVTLVKRSAMEFSTVLVGTRAICTISNYPIQR